MVKDTCLSVKGSKTFRLAFLLGNDICLIDHKMVDEKFPKSAVIFASAHATVYLHRRIKVFGVNHFYDHVLSLLFTRCTKPDALDLEAIMQSDSHFQVD